MVTSTERMRVFSDNPILGHITTFGGHPVCCAAGLANLKFLIEHHNQLAINEKESTFRECLTHPNIKEVSGKGLLLACYIDERIDIIQFNRELLNEGVFTDWFLFNQNAIRIAPPLIIEISQIKEICAIITKILDRYSF